MNCTVYDLYLNKVMLHALYSLIFKTICIILFLNINYIENNYY